MTTPRAFTVTQKSTGQRFHGEAKPSWGRTAYSFDRGDTWHQSLSAAFAAAEASGCLWQATKAHSRATDRTGGPHDHHRDLHRILILASAHGPRLAG